MASLWGSFGVESIAEQIGGAVSKASELAKDVIADGIEEDEVEVATRTLQSTAVERDDALQVVLSCSCDPHGSFLAPDTRRCSSRTAIRTKAF